jgi:signal transduction histidine kinase
MPVPSTRTALKEIKKEIKNSFALAQLSLKKMEGEARKNGNKVFIQLVAKEKKEQLTYYKKLLSTVELIRSEFKEEMKVQTESLRQKVNDLERKQEAAKANNFLLEVKRKKLLVESEELKNSTEEIRIKSLELVAQKEEITRQVNELKLTHEDLLERKNELEEKSNALLDQTDYLHDANQIILTMHEELGKQRDEILSKNEELQNLNLEKNNLIGIVAHDLKSPLNQIKGLVSIIKMTQEKMDHESANCLELIENSVNRLGSMISKILDIEAIESRQLNLSIQKMDISENVKIIADRFKQDAEHKEIKLHFTSPAHLHIEADHGYINQIFENLLSNAIKFSPPKKNIHICVDEQENKVLVAVKDEGPGMTEDDKKKLFNKYQKLSARPTGNESSTGLGLSIVKKFVEAMNGKIWCESEEGQGSTFYVEFLKA